MQFDSVSGNSCCPDVYRSTLTAYLVLTVLLMLDNIVELWIHILEALVQELWPLHDFARGQRGEAQGRSY